MGIISFLSEKRIAKRILRNFKTEIVGGYYAFNGLKNKIELLKNISYKENVIKKNFRIFHISGNGEHASFFVNQGTEKVLLICGDVVFAKYKNNNLGSLLDVVDRIKLFSKYLPIESCRYLGFNSENNLFKMERVEGVSFNDSEHAVQIASLFSDRGFVVQNPYILFKNRTLAYIQHGDPGLGNIIYKNGVEPVLIDNDNIGFYPALYDCFVVITYLDNSFTHLKDLYNNNFQVLKSKFSLIGQNFNQRLFDYYLSLFVYFRFMSYSEKTRFNEHRCFSFLKNEQAKTDFPITYEIFEKIVNKQPVVEYNEFYNHVLIEQENYKRRLAGESRQQ